MPIYIYVVAAFVIAAKFVLGADANIYAIFFRYRADHLSCYCGRFHFFKCYFVFDQWNDFVYFSTFVIVVEFIVGNNAVIPDLFVLIDHAIRALILEVFIMAGVLNRYFDF